MVRDIFKKAMEKHGYNNSTFATALGVDRSTISRFYKHGQELAFNKVVLGGKLLLTPRERHTVIEEYASKIALTENILMALEYTSVNNRTSTHLKLLEDRKVINGADDEYVVVYMDNYDRQTGKISDEEMLKKVRTRKLENDAMNVFQRIIGIYTLYKKNRYMEVIEHANETEIELNKLTCNYSKSSFLTRLSEPLAYTNLKVYADFQASRIHSNNIINDPYVNELRAASAHYNLGLSYLFEDYKKCIHEFTKSTEIYDIYDNPQYSKNVKNYGISLANLLYNKFNDFESSDPVLNAYYHAKMGQRVRALELLNNNSETLCTNAMTQFVAGVATGDDKLIWESISKFIEEGDLWMALLPCFELIRKGEEPHKVYVAIKLMARNFQEVEKLEKNFFVNVNDFGTSCITG